MFSVVIPLYNKELSIENTINSVLEQTYQDFEIIVVDDGSTDQSAQLIERIQDPRIRIIHQDNQGVSAARNRGIKEAKQEWIAFLDGDDLWENGHLEEICKMMSMFPDEKVFVTSFEYSDKRKTFKHPRNTPIFKIENYFKEAIQESLIWTSIAVISRECFSKVGYFNNNLNRGEDLDLWARLAKYYAIIKSQRVTAIYNLEDSKSLTKTKSHYHKSILSIISLRDKSGYERSYFKRMLINRLKLDLKTLDIVGFLKIVIRHNVELLR
ncbi:glycosyltransferase family 2 protein [Alkanindiges illinoisensis]|uniref:glycosyltransferase family 2 protein n=1 Tax=Alkanindiges illinoisensis TaxID=197183 RepID=UPI0006871E55|nr:glycosyltransferase family 2 protein [Alkanindiges illinoisensis]